MSDAIVAQTCQTLLSATSFPLAAAPLMEAALRHAQPDRVLVLIREAKEDVVAPVAAHGYGELKTAPPHTTPFSQHVMTQQKALILHGDEAHPLWQHRAPEVQSIMCLPISRGDHRMGVLFMETLRSGARFTPEQQSQIEEVMAPVSLAVEILMMTRTFRAMEHDMRNALGAANLLLFQILGSETDGSENYVPSLKDADSAELETLGMLAGTMLDAAERDKYMGHVQQLMANRQAANELLGGVRSAVNRALAITANLEVKHATPGTLFNQKVMKSRLRSSR